MASPIDPQLLTKVFADNMHLVMNMGENGENMILRFVTGRISPGAGTGPLGLWSGYSGADIALLSLGVKFYILAAEINPDVVKMADAPIDQMVHVPTVECVNAEMVRGPIKKRNILTILVGGGSPCQVNTSLNKGRKGLADPRSQQPKELVRIRDGLKKAFPNIAVLTFLENTASSPKEVKQEYDLLVGAKPVSINAGIFGWVDHKRLYWAASPHGEDMGWNS